MKFILQFTTGEKFKITKEEAELIAGASDNQSITIKRLGMVVQKRMAQIYPIEHPDVIDDRKRQLTGILHDGTKVRRHFGEWVCADNLVPDDTGDYVPVKLDRQYYPEVALDNVATEQEFKQIRDECLNYNEFMQIGGRVERLKNPSGFEHISEALK